MKNVLTLSLMIFLFLCFSCTERRYQSKKEKALDIDKTLQNKVIAQLNNVQLPEKFKKKTASDKEHYQWENEETKELSVFLLKKLPSQLFFDDFTKRLNEKIKNEKKEKVDEATLCEVLEESMSNRAIATFNNLMKRHIQQFKEEKSDNINNYESVMEKLKNSHLLEKIEKKITSVKERYQWESEETRELADYLLKRFPSQLLMDDLTKILDRKMREENKDKIDATVLCQTIEETFLTSTVVTFNALIRKYVQQFKKIT